LLAYLALTGPAPQLRHELVALLWGSHFEVQARQCAMGRCERFILSANLTRASSANPSSASCSNSSVRRWCLKHPKTTGREVMLNAIELVLSGGIYIPSVVL
jgi:hypothetical protein